jgi:hypothetical protein
MATSGNPATRAKQAKVKKQKTATSASAWKKNDSHALIELPSGNVAKIRRPGIPELMAAKVLPDSITPMAQSAIDKAQGKPVEEASTILKEEDFSIDEIAEMVDAFDKIAEMVFVEPPVRFHKVEVGKRVAPGKKEGSPDRTFSVYEDIQEEDRDDDYVYTDDIDMEDKVFVFNYAVGGTPDLERFRREYGASMGGVSSGEGVEVSAE